MKSKRNNFIFRALLSSFALLTTPNLFAEDVNLSTYYPSPYGSYRRLQIEEASDPALATFRGGVTRAGLQIISTYAANNFTPGVFWTTSNDNAAIPKAGIWMNEAVNASRLYFGTSNAYATGITNQMVLDQNGRLGINQTNPSFALDVNAGTVTTAKFGTSTPTYLAQVPFVSPTDSPDNVISFNAELRLGTGSPAPPYNSSFGVGSVNQYAGAISFSPNTGQMSFLTNNSVGNGGAGLGLFPTPRLTVDKDGNVDMPTSDTTLRVPRRGTTGNPAGQAGMVYYNTADNKFRGYQNGVWVDLVPAGGVGGPKFITPVTIYTGTAAVAWTTYNATSVIPAGATAVILDAEASVLNGAWNTNAYFRVRQNAAGSVYTLLWGRMNGSGFDGHTTSWVNQATFPLNVAGSPVQRTFDYTVVLGFNQTCVVRIIGYY